jgi:Flp pilus assembly protein TadG
MRENRELTCGDRVLAVFRLASGRLALKFSRLLRPVQGFGRREDGTATIEFVLWLPILVLLISLTADAALIFGAKANVLRVIQDANRAASIGRFKEEPDFEVAVENYVRTNIGNYARHATIATEVIGGNVVSTTVTIPSSRLMAVGFLGQLTGITVTINAQHMLEA